MRNYLLRFLFVLAIIVVFSLSAFGQVTTTASLSGTVTDPNGAVVPNATVVVKSVATNQEFTVQTNGEGVFHVPALNPGSYTATITAPGFKKAEVTGITVVVATPSSIKIGLEVGATSETVVITGAGGELLHTETATVGTSISGRQITELPYASRNALDLLLFLPGTNTVGRPRSSTVNGLPKGLLNITMDGVNIQDNVLKGSDGFFTIIQPKTDAVQEVSVSTATPGAESNSEGAVQIKFATRSGSNDFHGGIFWEHRDKSLNTNFFWNNESLAPKAHFGQPPSPSDRAPRTPMTLNQMGGRVGGPIRIPKLFNGKDKAFFFLNYEEYRLPEATLRTRLLLSPAAQSGVFTFGANTVNLYTLAAANGLTSTPDPTVGSLLTAIRSAAAQGSICFTVCSDPNVQSVTFNNLGFQKRQFPTARLDFELTKNNHLEAIYNYQVFRSKVDFLNNADPAFPGFPNFGSQASNRYSFVTAWRSTIKPNLVNEVRWGVQNGIVLFFPEENPAQFANQGGFNLRIDSAASGISNATAGNPGQFAAGNNAQRRNTPTYNFTDNLNWVRGKHTMNFGADVTSISTFLQFSTNGVVPTVSFAQDLGDTAVESVFTPSVFGSAAVAAQADSLYRVLVGRLNTINHSANLNETGAAFNTDQTQIQRFRQREIGMYWQDSWKFRSNLTLNFGLRYELQYAPIAQNSANTITTFAGLFGTSGTNFNALFSPGATGGAATQFNLLPNGQHLYNLDKRAWAPTFGFAYQPNFKSGILKRLAGNSGQTVIRGGWSMAYDREGLNLVSAITGNNFGGFVDLSQFAGAQFARGTLLRSLPAAPGNPAAPVFPLTPSISDAPGAAAFLPNLRTPYVISFSGGIQREITKDTVIEFSYVGNRGKKLFRTFNLNENNTIENGFANEVRLAQANLLANINAGRGANFRFFGPGTGTFPLPIFLGYFTGLSGTANVNDPAKYASSRFASTTFTTRLTPTNTTALGIAGVLNNPLNPFLGNAAAAGFPSNFFIVNPTMFFTGDFAVTNDTKSWYDAMTIQVRRRLSKGVLFDASYTFGKALGNAFGSSSIANIQPGTIRNTWNNKDYSPFDLRHAFKASYIVELPFGRGKRFLGNSHGIVNGLLGGWALNGTMRIQSGSDINLGNVQLVGMTRKELENLINARKGAGVVFWLPQDIIDNTRRAFQTCVPNATGCDANGYTLALGAPTGRYIAPAGLNCIPAFVGQCGFTTLIVHGPNFTRSDMGISKKINFSETKNLELRFEFLNAFNNINFRVGGFAQDAPGIGQTSNNTIPVPTFTSASFGQLGGVETAYRDTSTTNDPGGRVGQIVIRFNF